jgi:hypothetical protein
MADYEPDHGTQKLEPTPKAVMIHQLPRLKDRAVYLAEALFESSLFTDAAEKWFVPGDRLADGDWGVTGLKTNRYTKAGMYPPEAFTEMLTLLSFFAFREHVRVGATAVRDHHPVLLEVPPDAAAFADHVERDATHQFCGAAGAFIHRAGTVSAGLKLPAEREVDSTTAPPVPAGADGPRATEFAAGDRLIRDIQFDARVRSPFLAMCGRGDEFDSVDDLLTSTSQTVGFDLSMIPTMDRRAGLGLSAWLIDFFKHPGDLGSCHAHLRYKAAGKRTYTAFATVAHDIKVLRNVLSHRCKVPEAAKDACAAHRTTGFRTTCELCIDANSAPCKRHTEFSRECEQCNFRNSQDWEIKNPEEAEAAAQADDLQRRDVIDGMYKVAVLFERLATAFDTVLNQTFPWAKN